MAPHSSTLAWKIPCTEEPGKLQSMGFLRVRHYWETSLLLFTFMHALKKELATHSRVLAWRISGKEEPGGLPSMGLHRVGHDWSDLAAAAAAAAAFSSLLVVNNLCWKSPPSQGSGLGREKGWTGSCPWSIHFPLVINHCRETTQQLGLILSFSLPAAGLGAVQV